MFPAPPRQVIPLYNEYGEHVRLSKAVGDTPMEQNKTVTRFCVTATRAGCCFASILLAVFITLWIFNFPTAVHAFTLGAPT